MAGGGVGARVLVVNAGSSSLKLRLLDGADHVVVEHDLDGADGGGRLAATIRGIDAVDAVGHRVVHGGTRFREGVVIDGDVRSALAELVSLAPLHQPAALAALDAARTALPCVPHVACFDTAFHATIPAAAATYAVPAAWRERLGVRRFGFHGLSHAYAARRAAEITRRDAAPLRLVSCHLGAGASLCAVLDGRSVDTTMGFTPLEGLVMATRSGTVDPGLVLWLILHAGLDPGEVEEALEHRSGLLALADTADMREVLTRAAGRDDGATLALDVYAHRLRAGVAAMAASLGGLDVLVFTGRIGERSPAVRARAMAGLGFLGVAVDGAANAQSTGGGDAEISAPRSAVTTLVVVSREDLEIARQTRAALR